MDKLLMLNKIFGILAFIGAVISLLYKLNWTLIMSAVLMCICVVITFAISAKEKKKCI